MSEEPVVPPAMIRRVLFASVLGNAFEWFDFAIYGLFAATIAKLYFPVGHGLTSLVLTFATFGVGFVVRPLGGIVLGLYGDRVGRRRALSLTIALMAAGTGMIGLLPTYAAIGLGAPILITLARMIQGFSAGGEFGGATTMLVEFAPANRRGLFGSFQACSQALAISCGAAVAWLLTSHLSSAQFESWGWRLPFLFGILVGPVGWIIRSKIDESPEFLACVRAAGRGTQKIVSAQLRNLFKDHPRELLASTGICVAGTVSSYVFVFFVPIFAKQQLGITAPEAGLSTAISTAIILILCPFAGYLSDLYGRRTVLLPGILGYGLAAWLLFHHFVAEPSFYSLLELQAGVSFFMSFLWGPAPIVLTEIFPVHARSTGAALTYNFAVLTFGGLAPFINTWLVRATGSNLVPLYYVECSVLIGVLGACLLPGSVRLNSAARAIG